MFLKLDWGIIWPIVNIVVFYLLLRKFLFGPVSEVMEKRKKMISSDLDDAAQTKVEAEEIKQEYEKNLAQAKDEAGQIVSDARARAKNEYQNKMDQTKEEIALMRENARKDIEAEKRRSQVFRQRSQVSHLWQLRKLWKKKQMTKATRSFWMIS